MAREVKVLMSANPLQGPLERVGHENRDFFGPWNGNKRSECLLSPKKSQRHIKKTGTFVILCTWVLLQLYWYGWANPFWGPLKGAGPWKSRPFWAQMATKEAGTFWAQIVQAPYKKQAHWTVSVHEFCCRCTGMGGRIHFEGHWKGWALKILTFLGPTSCHLGSKKSRFSGPTPSNGPSSPHKNHSV